jgi:hypothetical protein
MAVSMFIGSFLFHLGAFPSGFTSKPDVMSIGHIHMESKPNVLHSEQISGNHTKH